MTRRQPHIRPPRARGAAALPRRLVLGCVVASLVGAWPGPGAAQMHTEGEYGLWVTDSSGEIGVGWLTTGARAGILRVLVGDSLAFEAETPTAGSHHVTFHAGHLSGGTYVYRLETRRGVITRGLTVLH